MSERAGIQPGRTFLAPEVLARIGSLELIARAVVEGFIYGLHRSPYLGFSTDFAEHRPYMPGDDTRHLDWKLLARTDRMYIKKYQGDTNAQVHLLIDTSGSMGYRGGYSGGYLEADSGAALRGNDKTVPVKGAAVTKLQYGQYLAAALAFLSSRQHDAVGLIAFDEEVVEHTPASARSGQFRTVIGVIERLTPGRATRLVENLHLAAEAVTRRGIFVVISDCYDEPGRIIDALEHLRFRGNEVVLFHILDRREIEFDFDETVILEDAEGDEEMHVFPEVIRDEYLRALKLHIKQLSEGAERNRIDYELLNTSNPLDSALFSYLSRRAEFG